MLLKWRSSISIFSQIYQFSKYESRKSQAPFRIVCNCDHFFATIVFIKVKNRPKNEKILLITSFTSWNGRRDRPAISPHKTAGGIV
jgi:hypothetical protein